MQLHGETYNYETNREKLVQIKRENSTILIATTCGIFYNPEKHGEIISLTSVRILYAPCDDWSKFQRKKIKK